MEIQRTLKTQRSTTLPNMEICHSTQHTDLLLYPTQRSTILHDIEIHYLTKHADPLLYKTWRTTLPNIAIYYSTKHGDPLFNRTLQSTTLSLYQRQQLNRTRQRINLEVLATLCGFVFFLLLLMVLDLYITKRMDNLSQTVHATMLTFSQSKTYKYVTMLNTLNCPHKC